MIYIVRILLEFFEHPTWFIRLHLYKPQKLMVYCLHVMITVSVNQIIIYNAQAMYSMFTIQMFVPGFCCIYMYSRVTMCWTLWNWLTGIISILALLSSRLAKCYKKEHSWTSELHKYSFLFPREGKILRIWPFITWTSISAWWLSI